MFPHFSLTPSPCLSLCPPRLLHLHQLQVIEWLCDDDKTLQSFNQIQEFILGQSELETRTHTRESLLGVTSPFHFFCGFKCAYRTALHLLRAGFFSSSPLHLPAVWWQCQSEGSGLEDLYSSSAAAGRRSSVRKTWAGARDARAADVSVSGKQPPEKASNI